jgi:competence protein ComEC
VVDRRLLRVVPVATAAWLSAGICVHAPAVSPVAAAILWAGAAASTAMVAWGGRLPGTSSARTRNVAPRAFLLAALSLAAAAGAASHVAVAQPSREAAARLELDGGRAISARATVVGKVEHRADGLLSFDARAATLSAGRIERAVDVEIIVRVRPDDIAEPARLDVGATVEARGTAHPGRPGERAVFTVWASRGVEVVTAPAGVTAMTSRLRHGLVRAVDGLPGEGAGLVPGLAVGDTSAVSAALDAAMKESSLSHLTAVSGANCALVVALAFGSAAAAGARRAVRVGVGLTALAGFVLLVTPEPSVVRAGTMAAIAMLSLLIGRRAAGMSILSLSVALLLIADPWLSGSLGFALSTAATAALLVLTRPLASGLERFLPRTLALAVAVPLAAQLACGPLLILISPQVPVYGVLANLLAAPAAPVATVVGLAACLSAPFPWLQSGFAALAWLPASWIAATAETFSRLPGDLLPWRDGWSGAAALAGAGAAVAVLIAVRPRGRRASRAARAVAAVVLAVLLGHTLGGGALSSVAGRWTLPTTWAIVACDVGQGDAVLLRSRSAVALIDTGPDPTDLRACLDRVGVSRIDLLVLTHFDLDHAGGVDAITGSIGSVLHGPVDPEDQHVLTELERGGARVVPASSGLRGSLGDADWRVVWPRADSRAFPPGNDASIVLDVRGGGIPPILLLGDLSASPQRAILGSGLLAPPYAVVKVAHHGSADQERGLYEEVSPSVAVVTVGAENDYGHPRPEVLDALTALGATIVRTDTQGLLALSSEPGGIAVWAERGG